MPFDFSQLPLNDRAFSNKPMTFCEADPKNALSAVFDILAIETGPRKPRENWQAAQLRNLVEHAANRSSFWKQRIGTRRTSGFSLPSLPMLTRGDVVRQVTAEGALLNRTDKIGVKLHSTSGSSGTPVNFHVSEMNIRYNHIRGIAQYFLERRDFALNRVIFISRDRSARKMKVEKNDSWLAGPLVSFLRGGIQKRIECFYPDVNALRQELERDPIGYLVAAPWAAEELIQLIEPSELKRAGLVMWVSFAGALDAQLRKAFTSVGIPVRTSYSAEEVGQIGFECEEIPGNYHVVTSNVIVEVSGDDVLQVGGVKLGRVLVTHLHSYATPFIRYDLGDVAALAPQCGCGHDGPTLSHIHGRSKNLLKRADGTVTAFYVKGPELAKIGKFTEFRIRQTDLANMTLEIGGRTSLEPKETEEFIKIIKLHAGDDFNVDVKPVAEIDWGKSTKRLAFHNPLL